MYPDINSISYINTFVNKIFYEYKKLNDKNIQTLIDKIGPESTLTQSKIFIDIFFLFLYI